MPTKQLVKYAGQTRVLRATTLDNLARPLGVLGAPRGPFEQPSVYGGCGCTLSWRLRGRLGSLDERGAGMMQ